MIIAEVPRPQRKDSLRPDYYQLAEGQDLLSVMPPEERLNFCKWNAVKYLIRAGKKDAARTIEDLGKTKRYVEVMLETLQKGAERG